MNFDPRRPWTVSVEAHYNCMSNIPIAVYATALGRYTFHRTYFLFIKATPTIVGEAHSDDSHRGLYILPLNFFLQRTVIAARRRSGAPSKVYQWLGPRCRQKVTRKKFANRPRPNFTRVKKCEIWPRFSTVAFEALYFRGEATYLKCETSHVAQSCYSVIGDKPFLWSKAKFDPP